MNAFGNCTKENWTRIRGAGDEESRRFFGKTCARVVKHDEIRYNEREKTENRKVVCTMANKALVVIDMQNDYLWENRKKMFTYDTEELVANVNQAIETYREDGYDIIYIKHILPKLLWGVGFSIRGTQGAKMYPGVKLESPLIFEKSRSNTFTSREFRNQVKEQGYEEMVLCGLDECGCVGATAKGAVKAGIKTYMLTDCIGRRFPEERVKKMREELQALGVEYI